MFLIVKNDAYKNNFKFYHSLKDEIFYTHGGEIIEKRNELTGEKLKQDDINIYIFGINCSTIFKDKISIESVMLKANDISIYNIEEYKITVSKDFTFVIFNKNNKIEPLVKCQFVYFTSSNGDTFFDYYDIFPYPMMITKLSERKILDLCYIIFKCEYGNIIPLCRLNI